jgi:hypothetical protein
VNIVHDVLAPIGCPTAYFISLLSWVRKGSQTMACFQAQAAGLLNVIASNILCCNATGNLSVALLKSIDQ